MNTGLHSLLGDVRPLSQKHNDRPYEPIRSHRKGTSIRSKSEGTDPRSVGQKGRQFSLFTPVEGCPLLKKSVSRENIYVWSN